MDTPEGGASLPVVWFDALLEQLVAMVRERMCVPCCVNTCASGTTTRCFSSRHSCSLPFCVSDVYMLEKVKAIFRQIDRLAELHKVQTVAKVRDVYSW